MFSITMPMIMDELVGLKYESHIPESGSAVFTRHALLADKNFKPGRDTIYIGDLSTALRLRGENFFYAICLRDRIADETENSDSLNGLVIVNENIPFADFLSLVEAAINKIIYWTMEMQSAIITGCNMQKILDISEDILKNHISVSDSSMKLIAHTANIPCDCPIVSSLIRKGFHSEHMVAEFRRLNLFQNWTQRNEIFVAPPSHLTKYATASRVFSYCSTYFEHVVMTCNRRELSQGLIDTFEILCKHLEIYIKQDWEARSAVANAHDALLTELLEGNYIAPRELEERAGIVDLPVRQNYNLLVIKPNVEVGFPFRHIADNFASVFIDARCVCYDHTLVVLFSGAEIDRQLKESGAAFNSFLQKYNARCVISPDFRLITDIRRIYLQSSRILEDPMLAQLKSFSPNIYSGIPGGLISDYRAGTVPYMILESPANAETWYNSRMHDLMLLLRDYDRTHKTDLMNLLYVHLIQERRATETASILNMHRNTVLYHIERIQELLGVDLDDPQLRLRLLNAYLMLRIFGFRPDC